MDREAYNVCMKPHMSGKGKSKQERRQAMCIGAKLCTGKAKNEQEAAIMCAAPKMPKWAKGAEPVESTSCDERVKMLTEDLDVIQLKVREGEAAEVKALAGRVLVIGQTCLSDPFFAKAVEAMDGVHELSTRHYLKGEAKEVIRQIDGLKEEIR